MPKAAKWVIDAMESVMASKMPWMQVIHTHYLNDRVKIIRLQGNISGMDFQLGYAVLIRVSNTECRNYTVSLSEVKSGLVELTVHLHGNGPGSWFMDRLREGDQLRISMPRGVKQYDKGVKRQLIFGDETSLGLACAFQPVLRQNNHQFQFYFELDAENENLPHLLGLENCTVFPKNNTFNNEQLLNELLSFQPEYRQNGNFVLTGNARSIQIFRKVLRQQKMTGRIFAKAYWLEGKTGL
jgi:NADPH-dependent ferric siderophore reductase